MDEIDALKAELKQTRLAYEMAAHMNEFKAGFLARTSHELRAPLSSLIGLHQLILSDLCESTEEEREFIAQAHDSALKMVQLMDAIITVAKVEYGSAPVEIKPLKLAQVLEEVHRLTHIQAGNCSLLLEVKASNSHCYVMGDFSRLLQALVNLVDTSIVLMQDGQIKLYEQHSPGTDTVAICLDLQCSHEVWSEPVDLLKNLPLPNLKNTDSLTQIPKLSPGMKLLLTQNLLASIGGSLEVVAATSAKDDNLPLTRLQCRLPLALDGTQAGC